MEQRAGEFAMKYREYIKEHFSENIGSDHKPEMTSNTRCKLRPCRIGRNSPYELSGKIIPDVFTYKTGDGIIKKGVALTLNEDLNIMFGKNSQSVK